MNPFSLHITGTGVILIYPTLWLFDVFVFYSLFIFLCIFELQLRLVIKSNCERQYLNAGVHSYVGKHVIKGRELDK